MLYYKLPNSCPSIKASYFSTVAVLTGNDVIE